MKSLANREHDSSRLEFKGNYETAACFWVCWFGWSGRGYGRILTTFEKTLAKRGGEELESCCAPPSRRKRDMTAKFFTIGHAQAQGAHDQPFRLRKSDVFLSA